MGYAGTGIAFDVLLPKTLNSLPDLEKSLTQESLTRLSRRALAFQILVENVF
jgi:hypothetical protein